MGLIKTDTHTERHIHTLPFSLMHVELFLFGSGTPSSFVLPPQRVSCIFHAVEALCVREGSPLLQGHVLHQYPDIIGL